MAAQVTLVCGPARTGKTGQMLAHYRRQLAAGLPGGALWISPTRRSAGDIRERLLDESLPACFAPGVYTFNGFADLVLSAAPQAIRPISSHIRRRLVARLLQRAAAGGELKYFAPIAETEGLVDLVTGWISELKRLEIWPEHFAEACRKRGAADKDRELVAIYQAYQDALTRHQLYDHEGRFWTARELLAAGHWGPVAEVERIVIDGFTDFTHTQLEILELLAGRAKDLWITLPLEAETKRHDLFAKSLGTLAQLQKRFPNSQVQQVARGEQSDWSTLDHLERQIFSAPQDAVSLPSSANVEILAASRRLGEIELVGRRVKGLMVQEGVKASDIAVVFRSLSEPAPMVREVFRELGIPFAIETQQSLLTAPALKALVALMRLHVEDWPFRELLAILTNNYFQPRWSSWQKGAGAAAAEMLVRSLQVPHGRETLLHQGENRWKYFQAQAAAEESVAPHAAARASETYAGLVLLQKLAEVLDELPRRATLAEWGPAWRQLAETTGLMFVVAEPPPAATGTGVDTAEMAALDKAACDQLFAVLAGGDRLAQWLGEDPPELDAAAALAELVDLLQAEPLPRKYNETGCVRVLAAPHARTLDIPYLFLAGLSEKSFPQPDYEGLYTEVETRGLKEKGLRLVSRAERNQEELLLFYEVLTRPSKRLYLSYPALDEKAQPLSPSSYLLEVERACGLGVIPRWEEPDLSPLPRGKTPLGYTDQRLMALAQFLQNEPAPLARLLAHPPRADFAEQLRASLLVTNARQRGDSFGPYEGVLKNAATKQLLTDQFGPSHAWSASRLETYAYCPFRFFAGDVLGVAPLEDLALEVDYGARGALLHDALSHIHRQLNQLAARTATPSDLDVEEFIKQLDEALDAMIKTRQAASRLEEAQREIDRRTLARWGKQYHEQHVDYDSAYAGHESPMRPAHFEVRFGPRRRDADPDDPISTDEPFAIKLGEETLLLTGRIDRIDRGVIAGQRVFNVLDYKSGRFAKITAAEIASGVALQLPLYTMAAQELLLRAEGDVPWQAGYWTIRDKGFNQKQALVFYEQQEELLLPSELWQQLREQVLERVALIVAGIRAGEFPMFSQDENCTGRCEFHTVCRVNQARSLEKVWPPPTPELAKVIEASAAVVSVASEAGEKPVPVAPQRSRKKPTK